ncbi:MAG: hypothetical protein ACREXX_14230 [Gammaproteobacteria bacterium]
MLTRLTPTLTPPASQGRELWNTKFGEGVVFHADGLGEHARIQVNFERGRDRVAGGGLHGSTGRVKVCEEIYCARALTVHPRRAQQGRSLALASRRTRAPFAWVG